MSPNSQAIEQAIEPWVVRLLRKTLTFALTALLVWLAARGVHVDVGLSATWAAALSMAIGVPLSYLLSRRRGPT
jgi:hypothetical protein